MGWRVPRFAGPLRFNCGLRPASLSSSLEDSCDLTFLAGGGLDDGSESGDDTTAMRCRGEMGGGGGEGPGRLESPKDGEREGGAAHLLVDAAGTEGASSSSSVAESICAPGFWEAITLEDVEVGFGA